MKYRCDSCGKFIGEIKSLNCWMFTRSKRLELEGDKLLVTCKCGHVQKIDLKDYEESVENEEI